jgi:hypothetical protein
VGNVGNLLEAELIESGGEAARIQGQPGVQLERRGVHACRNIPAAILKLEDRTGTDDEHVDEERAEQNHYARSEGRIPERLLELEHTRRLSPLY